MHIDIETCCDSDGAVAVIACVKAPVVIHNIRTHLNEKAAPEPLGLLLSARAPPSGPFG
ncbi:hypothetical protein [Aquisalimonas sp.]|uniref:hypothetical protein n=1 Tax=Aquisalimonas sp. TaxID=1872621 RepID=UPI0025B8036A|nr:hypothetical protein [Aquisalimonas sp.]